MTSFAHVGGGILVAAAVQRLVFQEEIAPSTIVAGAILGFLPDLDSLLAIVFGGWAPGKGMLTHHRQITHTPLLYLLCSVILLLLADWKVALIFGAVTISHLAMDSWCTDDGIMWLWPLKREQYSLFPRDLHTGGLYGWPYYRLYFKTPSLWIPELFAVTGGVIVVLLVLWS
jgi:membrane-bound metal-dependent hydrolase YbcI (DUF457 family)